jgi:hypothetical protein
MVWAFAAAADGVAFAVLHLLQMVLLLPRRLPQQPRLHHGT